LFGAEYRGAFGILVVLLAAHLLGAALGPAQQVLMMSGQQKAVMRVMALSAICHIAGLFILIPWLGALGAAVATLLSTTVARLGCLRMVRSRLGIEPSVLRAAENGNSCRDGRRP
jgi:O-antigen/teichoic acid export membrane protein